MAGDVEPRAGKPTKLTAGRHERIIRHIRNGMSLEAACQREHVTSRTARAWAQRGRAYKQHLEGGGPVDPESHAIELRYFRFAQDIDQSRAAFEGDALAGVLTAGLPHTVTRKTTTTVVKPNGDTIVTTVEASEERQSWQALAWLLERLYPAKYARVTKLEHTGEDGAPIVVDATSRNVNLNVDLDGDNLIDTDERLEAVADALFHAGVIARVGDTPLTIEAPATEVGADATTDDVRPLSA